MKHFAAFLAFFLSLSNISTVLAVSSSFKDAESGYTEIKYKNNMNQFVWSDTFLLSTIGAVDKAPLSSLSQGSVFNEIFEDLAKEEHIVISVNIPRSAEHYENLSRKLEKELDKWNAQEYRNSFFGKYFEYNPYSKMVYIYPAFFENEVYIITSPDRKINVEKKSDLNNFKGAYVSTDYFSSYVLKDFANLKMAKTESFEKAFEQLLTGKVDYVAANYYPSLIALYKLGLREYVTYSQAPAWKMALFITATPKIANHPRMKILKKYFQSERYKKVRDEALTKMVDFYKETYKGTVPPAFINKANRTPEQNQTPLSKAVEQE